MPTFGYRRWLIFACKNPPSPPLRNSLRDSFWRPPPLGSPCQQGEPKGLGSPHAVGGTYRRGAKTAFWVPRTPWGEPTGEGVQQGTGTVPLPERYGRSSRARTLTP
jgi:hypothetical protein